MRQPFISLLALSFVAACGETATESAEGAPSPQSSAETAPNMLEVIATGANIAGSNGIHFGPDGLLYITSVVGSDITVIDPESGDEVKRLTAAEGVIGPDDIAFASDGSYYWTSILTGEVAGFTAAGEKVTAAQLEPGVNPITFSDDDRLFVSQCFLGTNLYELDPTGEAEPRLIADDLGPGCGLNGMDWGPDRRLYGPRWFHGEVVSYDVDTNERRVEANGFTTPAAIKFDSEGVLHVLDTGTGELIRVTETGRETAATLEPGLDNFAFDANDTPFVSSYTDGFIKRVNADGTISTLQPGGLSHPGGLAVIGDTVWVGDGNALRGFDRQTGEAVATQRNIVGMGEQGGTINVSADGDALILTSWFDGDARIWDPNAEQRLAHFTDLAGPIAAIRYGAGVAIAEHFKGAVTLYSESEPVLLASGLAAPTALVVQDGALYVGDRTQGQILRIAQDGVPLETPELVISGLAAPEGIVGVEDGFVVVEADAGRIVKVDLEGNIEELGSISAGSVSVPGLPPSQIFNGIAADEDGNLYIASETSRELYRIKAPY